MAKTKNKKIKDYKIKRAIVKAVLRFFVIIMYRPKKIGEENIPQGEGVILCPNHIHALDPAVIVLNTKRQVCFMAKQELYKYRILRWLGKVFGIFPVKRGTADIEATKNALRVIKEKKILGIFPEGTRKRTCKKRKGKKWGSIFCISYRSQNSSSCNKGDF